MPVKQESCASVYDLAQTVEFARLSPKQAVWVLVYCQNFLDTGVCDPLSATKAAYNCATDETARIFGYQVQGKPKVRLVLNRFFGDSPEEAVQRTELDIQIAELRTALKTMPPYAQERSRRLLAELTGLRSKGGADEPDTAFVPKRRGRPPKNQPSETESVSDSKPTAETAPKFFVGQLVNQRDDDGVLHTGRVLAVDANGLPTQFEELL